jgi:hypothetical protein
MSTVSRSWPSTCLGPDLSLPDTLAGAERLTDVESARFERYMADEGDRYGIDAGGGEDQRVEQPIRRVFAGGRGRGRNGGTERHEARE